MEKKKSSHRKLGGLLLHYYLIMIFILVRNESRTQSSNLHHLKFVITNWP